MTLMYIDKENSHTLKLPNLLVLRYSTIQNLYITSIVASEHDFLKPGLTFTWMALLGCNNPESFTPASITVEDKPP